MSDERFWKSFFASFGAPSASGEVVSADTAMRVSAVYACVRVLSETIASLPLYVYRRRTDGGKDEAVDHPLFKIIHDSPNEFQTSFENREQYMTYLCLRGNAFNEVVRNGSRVLGLIPRKAEQMIVELKAGKLVYTYTHDDGVKESFPAERIWHLRGLSTDGYVGISPLDYAKESIGLSISAEKYGGRYFRNNAQPGGILKVPGRLSDDTRKRLPEQWKAKHSGDNLHNVAVLEEGLEFQPIGVSNEQAQFLELRNFQVEDIARIFRVPAILIGHPDKTMTYASAEQFFLSFVVHTIRPWLVRIEQSINKNLFTDAERKQGYFAEFKIDGLLRGDIKSRYEAFAIARQNTWMSANEIRKLENMNPIEGGDEYANPNITVDKGSEDKDGTQTGQDDDE